MLFNVGDCAYLPFSSSTVLTIRLSRLEKRGGCGQISLPIENPSFYNSANPILSTISGYGFKLIKGFVFFTKIKQDGEWRLGTKVIVYHPSDLAIGLRRRFNEQKLARIAQAADRLAEQGMPISIRTLTKNLGKRPDELNGDDFKDALLSECYTFDTDEAVGLSEVSFRDLELTRFLPEESDLLQELQNKDHGIVYVFPDPGGDNYINYIKRKGVQGIILDSLRENGDKEDSILAEGQEVAYGFSDPSASARYEG